PVLALCVSRPRVHCSRDGWDRESRGCAVERHGNSPGRSARATCNREAPDVHRANHLRDTARARCGTLAGGGPAWVHATAPVVITARVGSATSRRYCAACTLPFPATISNLWRTFQSANRHAARPAPAPDSSRRWRPPCPPSSWPRPRRRTAPCLAGAWGVAGLRPDPDPAPPAAPGGPGVVGTPLL